MSHVFISYAHDDGKFVKQILIPRLMDANITRWVDSEDLRGGDDWRKAIDDAIENAFSLIVVMTPIAKDREYVTYEWSFAFGAKKVVIPLMVIPTRLHPRLEVFQYLNFVEPHNAEWDKLIYLLKELENEYISREAVQRAKSSLNSSKSEERKNGVKSLKQMNAREELVHALQNPYPDVRINAAFALAKVAKNKDSRVVPGLIEALRSKKNTIRCQSSQVLEKIDKIVDQPIFQEAVHDSDLYVRQVAINIFAQQGNKDHMPILLEALNDEDKEIRLSAIVALRRIKDLRSVPHIMNILRYDSEAAIRIFAAQALGEIGDTSAVSGLSEILAKKYAIPMTSLEKFEQTFSFVVLKAVSEALSLIGTPEALAAVEQWQHEREDKGASDGH